MTQLSVDTSNNDIKHYTAEDISRYWSGKLSPQEMHAMEKAAMDDPFLADALEGYSSAGTSAIAADVRELHSRLKERVKGASVVPLKRNRRWWAVAAVLILLCGAAALVYKLSMQADAGVDKLTATTTEKESKANENQSTALEPKDTVAIKPGADSTARLSDARTTASLQKPRGKNLAAGTKATKEQNAVTQGDTHVNTEVMSAKIDSVVFTAKPTDKDNQEYKLTPQKNDSPSLAENNARRYVPQALQGRAAGIQQRNATRDNEQRGLANNNSNGLVINNFNGRIVDRNNMPIPFATVRADNAQLTTSDQSGNFQFRSFDSVVNLSVTSVGYEPRQFTMRHNQPQDVVLEETKGKLSEVVVTGYGSAKKKQTTSQSSLKVYVMDAQPEIGWDEYNKYIERNKRIDSLEASVQGEVVLSFTVSKAGGLSNFNIEKSLGKKYDAEALRLVREGPRWRVLKNKKARAKVIIPF